MTYECPLCGDDPYQAPTAGGVKGHITASTGDEHKGRNGAEWDDEDLRAGADDGADDGAQSAADGAAESGGADTGADAGGGASGPPMPEGGCPECGTDESVRPSALLRSMGVEPGRVPEASEYDHACRSCTEADGELVVWNE